MEFLAAHYRLDDPNAQGGMSSSTATQPLSDGAAKSQSNTKEHLVLRHAGQFLAVLVALAVFAIGCVPCMSELPDAPNESAYVAPRMTLTPKPARFRVSRLTWTLFVADAAVRALDGYSTLLDPQDLCSRHSSATSCTYEKYLPDWITCSHARLYAFEGSVPITEIVAAQILGRRHRRLAALIPAIDAGALLPVVVNNFRISKPSGGLPRQVGGPVQ